MGEAEEGEDLVKPEEGGDDGADTKAWIKKQKKRAKELAAKRAKELDEMEKRAAEEGLAKYDEEDLKGIKVAHGEDDFEEGEETVLTLKDSRVLDDEGEFRPFSSVSSLADVSLDPQQTTSCTTSTFRRTPKRPRRSLSRRRDEPQVNTPDTTTTSLTPPKSDPPAACSTSTTRRFSARRRAASGSVRRPLCPRARRRARARVRRRSRKRRRGSSCLWTTPVRFWTPFVPAEQRLTQLAITESFNTDYLQEGDVGFKVKKKKKRPPTRAASSSLADDVDPTAMDVDSPSTSAAPTLTHTNLDETNLIDDDDLQASLARSRREASKKKILEMKKRKEALAAAGGGEGMELDRVKEESDDEGAGAGGDADDVLVLDDTSEFVRNITLAAAAPPALRTNGAVAVKQEEGGGAHSVMPVIKAEPEDVPLEDVPLAELGEGTPSGGRSGWGAAREDGEESDEDMAMGGIDSVVPTTAADDIKPKIEDDEIGGSSGSVLVSKGMASTLSLLRHQGLIVPRTPEELERDRVQKEREAWLAAQRKRDREREEEKQRSRAAGSSIDQQQREYENRMREQRDAQATLEAFNNYKPNVNLTYHDEFGRDQTPKEVSSRSFVPTGFPLPPRRCR